MVICLSAVNNTPSSCCRHQMVMSFSWSYDQNDHISSCSFIMWILKTLLVIIVIPHVWYLFVFQEAPTGNSTLFRTLETGLLESTQLEVENYHLRLHLSESTIHSHSEGAIEVSVQWLLWFKLFSTFYTYAKKTIQKNSCQDQRVGAGVEGAIEVSVHKLLPYKMFSTFSTFAILRPTKTDSKLTLNIRTTSSHPNQHRKGSWAPALRAPPRWACTNCFLPKDFPHS